MKTSVELRHGTAREGARPGRYGKVTEASVRIPDARSVAAQAIRTQDVADASPRLQGARGIAALAERAPVQRNALGLPTRLQAGIEALSGLDMSAVRVHRNSSRPAALGASAYAQGRDIHLGHGQEGHLPHEAWHVVQQAQGRVRPTIQMKSPVVSINDDASLEREADVMGARASHAARSGIWALPPVAGSNSERHLRHGHWAERAHAQLQIASPVIQAGGWDVLNRLDPRRYLPEALGGYGPQEMAELDGANRDGRVPHNAGAEVDRPLQESGAFEEDEAEAQRAVELQRESEAEKKKWTRQEAALALCIFVAAVAYQKYRERHGRTARGRGNHMAARLLGDLDRRFEDLSDQAGRMKDAVDHATDLSDDADENMKYRDRPFSAGFQDGLDPWPMPWADNYVSLAELRSTVSLIVFLLGANREEIDEFEERVARFSLRNPAPADGGLPGAVSASAGSHGGWTGAAGNDGKDSLLANRTRIMSGFAAGAMTSSAIMAQLPVVSSNVLAIQPVWDAVHMVNMVAQETAARRAGLEGAARRHFAYKLRISKKIGQRKIARKVNMLVPTARIAAPILFGGALMGAAYAYSQRERKKPVK